MRAESFAFHRPFANSNPPTEEPAKKTSLQKVKDEVLTIFQRPTTGRTTPMGRKVEKPSDTHTDGPSGQRDTTRHDKQHANR
ncbi:MAG: hypothetical protein ABUU24_03495 [Variovorax sp.]